MSGGSDPYVYRGTDTLRNLANIRNPRELATFEAEAPHLLEHEAESIFIALHRAAMLRGVPAYKFAREAALLLAALNTLHPFREGYGRTQRAFVQAVAEQAGHPVYFDVVSRERMVRASILSTAGDSSMMIRLLHEITDVDRVKPLRRAISFLDANGFKWNDIYIATTTARQTYGGRLVGRHRDAFMMRTATDQIVIGNQSDIPPEASTGDQLSFTANWPQPASPV
jgi:cell filamentation protein